MQTDHPNRKHFSQEEQDTIRQLRAENCSTETIATLLHVGKDRVRRFCRENNIIGQSDRPTRARVEELKQIQVDIPDMPNAACRGEGTELFFLLNSDKSTHARKHFMEQTARAISICKSCEHQKECLDYALLAEPYGIWGGTTDAERQYLRKKFSIECVREVVVRIGTFSNYGYRARMTLDMLDAKYEASTVVQEYIKTHG